MIEKIGMRNKPIKNASGSSAQYGASAANGYSTATATTEGTTARRRPSRSINRPRHGDPIPAPIVDAAATTPACA